MGRTPARPSTNSSQNFVQLVCLPGILRPSTFVSEREIDREKTDGAADKSTGKSDVGKL